MRNFLVLPAIILLATTTVVAQSSKAEFEISLPKKAVSGSLYTTIQLLDSREDTAFMGNVQKGLLHTTASVVFEPSLPVQLAAVMQQLVGTKSAGDTLVFQLRHLIFSQKPGYIYNKSYCFMKADLYAARGGQYIPLASLDTLITIKTSTKGTSFLFNGASKCITSFIAASLPNDGGNTAGYSWNTLLAIDSLEKSTIPIYSTTAYTEGIYGTWEAFKNQQPEWTSKLIAEPKDGKITDADFLDKDSTRKYLDAKHVFAIVYNGTPYITGEDGYYLMKKRNNSLFLQAKRKCGRIMEKYFWQDNLWGR